MNPKARAKQILKILKDNYPDAKISLSYSNNFELLIAVMLSAQTTDKQVNKVTQNLFKKYESPEDFANADIKTLEKDIKSIGLYKTKAKNVKRAARIILNNNDKVPNSMKGLLELPGVGRKTANVVLAHAFKKIEGIAVDTHVKRLSYQLGLTKQKDPEKIEKDLMKIFDKKDWRNLTHLFIAHGRKKDRNVDLLLNKIKI